MSNYKKQYFKAFNGISDAIERLIRLQQQLEEEYISTSENTKESYPLLQLVKKEKTQN